MCGEVGVTQKYGLCMTYCYLLRIYMYCYSAQLSRRSFSITVNENLHTHNRGKRRGGRDDTG